MNKVKLPIEAHEDLVKNDMEDSDVQNHLNVNRAKETTFHENYGDGLLALYLIEESSISEDHPIIFRSALVLDLFGKDNRQSNLQDEYVIAHGVHDILLISANGLGMHAVSGRDQCEVSLKFPSDTIPKWKDPKTGELEGLSFDFNLCEAVATWEQVRNSTTVLTREFIDALPNGWEKYAWRRINKGNLGCTGTAKTDATAAPDVYLTWTRPGCGSDTCLTRTCRVPRARCPGHGLGHARTRDTAGQ
ncbi:hypothetical protein OROGR_008222 [Orobanche gracilis]